MQYFCCILTTVVPAPPEQEESSMLAVVMVPLVVTFANAQAAQDSARVVRYEFTVEAPSREVWAAWTTDAGLRTFFSPAGTIELKTFGRFELHFDADAAAGSRGAEGNLVLAVEPERMLTTTWDAPPSFPNVRAQRTFLEIRLAPQGAAGTRVTIVQSGFGESAEWQATHRYFLGAWTWVAAALQHRFEVGPIDWQNPPDLLPRMKAIGGEVAVQWAQQKR
jgi:uncharacterized protein YndB with AHSA1/START domain